MIQLLVIAFCLGAIVVSFFSRAWSWIVIGVPVAYLCLTLATLKSRKWKEVPELSELANRMLQKFGHFYAMPFASRDFSAAASTVGVASAVIAIIGLFKSFWIGIAIAVVVWLLMGLVARAFNPTNFLADEYEWLAHNEIIAYLGAQQRLAIFRENPGGAICIRCGAQLSDSAETDHAQPFYCPSCGQRSIGYDAEHEYVHPCCHCGTRSVLDRSELRSGMFDCPSCSKAVKIYPEQVETRRKGGNG